MRTVVVLIALALAVPALAVPALAADEPGTFGMAQRGSLKIVSGVLLNDRGGEMKGVWLNAKQCCFAHRTLRVSIQIDLVSAAGKTTRIKRSRAGRVENCAEGGPNFGYDLKPRALGMGCASGRWRPGRYSMITKTNDTASGLIAQASLYRQVTRRC